jgi:hypothetical protein
MLRFLSERRVWVVAVLVAFSLMMTLFLWGAPLPASRASTLIGDRLGVDAHIDQARLVLGGVELVGVEMRGRHGGFVIRVDQVDARMSLLGAIFRGAKSVRAVSARGIEVTADLTHEGLDESIAELPGRTTGAATGAEKVSPETSGRARTYAVDDLTVRVADSDGPLVSMTGVSLHKDGEDLRAGVLNTLLGEKDSDHATFGVSKLTLSRNAGAWKLREFEIEGASVRSLQNGDGETRALGSRIRDAISLLRGGDSGPGTDAGTDAGTDTGADTGTDAGTDTGADTGTDDGTDTGADTDTDTGAGAGATLTLTPTPRSSIGLLSMLALPCRACRSKVGLLGGVLNAFVTSNLV